MHVEIQAKSKEPDGWQLVNVTEIEGETLRDALAGFVGKPIVVEVDVDGKKFYCCGTGDLRVMMATRGRAVINQDASRMFEMLNPRILEVRINIGFAEQIFGGSQIEKITVDLPDHEDLQTTFF